MAVAEAVKFGADGVKDALADLADGAGLALEFGDNRLDGRITNSQELRD